MLAAWFAVLDKALSRAGTRNQGDLVAVVLRHVEAMLTPDSNAQGVVAAASKVGEDVFAY